MLFPTRMPKNRFLAKTQTLIAVLFTAVLFFVVTPQHAFAATEWDDNFESYSNGVWSPNEGTVGDFGGCTRDLTIQSSVVYSGTKALKADRTGSGANCVQMYWDPGVQATDDGMIYSWVWQATQWVAGVRTTIIDEDGNQMGVLASGGNITLSGGTGIPGGPGAATNTWLFIEWQVNFTSLTQRARINGGAWSSTESITAGASAIDRIWFWVAPGSNTDVYWDNMVLTGSSLGDPRTAPITAFDPAFNNTTWSQNFLLLHVFPLTNVFSGDYPTESGVVDVRVYRNDEHVQSFTLPLAIYNTFDNDPWGADLWFNSSGYPIGEYNLDARACFDGFSCGDYSDKEDYTFTITGINTGIGSDPSGILGEGQVGSTPWQIANSYPSKSSIYGDCSAVSWDDFLDPVAECLFGWASYVFLPIEGTFGDIFSGTRNLFTTRWPVSYFTQTLGELRRGYETGSDDCPLPTEVLGTTTAWGTLPSFDPCQSIDDANFASMVQSNSLIENALIAAIYLQLVAALIIAAKTFFDIRN